MTANEDMLPEIDYDMGGRYEAETGWEYTAHEPLEGHQPLEDHQPLEGTAMDIFGDTMTIPPAPQIETPKKIIGQEAHILNFYEGPKKCKCCINWVEKPPTQVPEESMEQYRRAAIIVYRSKNHRASDKTIGGLTALTIDTIRIQSPYIISAITPLMEDIGMPVGDKVTVFYRAPFAELYFSHAKIMDLAQSKGHSSSEGQHLEVLIDVMNEIFAESGPQAARLHADKMVTCTSLWTIFPKGMLVWARINDQDRIFEVVEMQEGIHIHQGSHNGHWTMTCRYLQFDGTEFGWTATKLRIPEFHGAQKIVDLPVYPLGFHADPNLEKRLLKRGERVVAFQDTSYQEYDGVACGVYEVDEDDEDDENDDARYQSSQKYYVRHPLSPCNCTLTTYRSAVESSSTSLLFESSNLVMLHQ